MNPKPWYESRTLWVGIIQNVVGIYELIVGGLFPGETEAPGWVLIVGGILTILLRFLTDRPVTTKKARPPL